MLSAKIYAHARRAPERIALVYNNNRMHYGQFARLIEASRRHLMSRVHPGAGGVAVLAIGSALDAWIQGLALRSLGLTTVISEDIGRLDVPAINCVVVTEAEYRYRANIVVASAAAQLPFIRVPRAVYTSAATAPLPDARDVMAAPGGHILRTSGTTGTYKKILIDPAAEAAICAVRQQVFEVSDQSVVNLFDFGGWTGVGYQMAAATWDAGGCVVMNEGPNPHESFRYAGITHAFVTPHLLTRILAAPPRALRCDDSLRLFVSAGPLSWDMAQAAKIRLTRRVYHFIGSTEAKFFTMTPVETAEDVLWHRVLPPRVVQVVDDHDSPVPPGQVGRLRVNAFDAVASYLHNEDASREFFRDGYFYTGDLAVFRPDGRFALQGRVTDVINVRGDKVAAGPIEETLRQRLGVGAVCIFSLQHEDGGEMVHVAIESNLPVDRSRLTAALDGTLLSTVRTQFHFVDTLPRNHMGKVQRDMLRQRLGIPMTTP